MYHVQKLCAKALWLDHGRSRAYGDASLVARDYLAFHEQKMAKHTAHAQVAAGEYLVTSLVVTPVGGGSEVDAIHGFDVRIEVKSPDARPPVVAVGVVRADGTPVYGTTSEVDGATPERIAHDRFGFSVRFSALPLLPGHYRVRAHAADPAGMRLFDHHEAPFVVAGASRELGLCRLPHAWSHARASGLE